MSFTLDMKKFTEKATNNVELAIKSIVAGVAESLIEMSPVGDPARWDADFISAATKLGWIGENYTGGRFRGNWDYGFNQSPNNQYDVIDKIGAISKGRIETALLTQKMAGGVHYLANNLPYAQRLEDGYSKVAPSGMVKITVIKWQSIVDEKTRDIK